MSVGEHVTVQYGYVNQRLVTRDGHKVLVGPFSTREAAQAAAYRDDDAGDVVEWYGWPGPGNPCPDCGSTLERLPMSDAAGKVYDALFPSVLDWSESEDCGMNELMRSVAEAAAAALGASTDRP